MLQAAPIRRPLAGRLLRLPGVHPEEQHGGRPRRVRARQDERGPLAALLLDFCIKIGEGEELEAKDGVSRSECTFSKLSSASSPLCKYAW